MNLLSDAQNQGLYGDMNLIADAQHQGLYDVLNLLSDHKTIGCMVTWTFFTPDKIRLNKMTKNNR